MQPHITSHKSHMPQEKERPIHPSMAALSPASSSNLLLLLLLASAASAIEFRVGGPRGWTEPTDNQSETYNHWAGRNRFHIGDTLNFKYENDSVLVVDRPGYSKCNTTSPLLSFNDGNTTVRFDRYGFYYFISGDTSHCNSGQKLIIRVMVHPESLAPASPGPAVAPSPGKWSPGSGSGSGSGSGRSGHSGPSTSNGSSKASYTMVIAGLACLFVVLMFV